MQPSDLGLDSGAEVEQLRTELAVRRNEASVRIRSAASMRKCSARCAPGALAPSFRTPTPTMRDCLPFPHPLQTGREAAARRPPPAARRRARRGGRAARAARAARRRHGRRRRHRCRRAARKDARALSAPQAGAGRRRRRQGGRVGRAQGGGAGRRGGRERRQPAVGQRSHKAQRYSLLSASARGEKRGILALLLPCVCRCCPLRAHRRPDRFVPARTPTRPLLSPPSCPQRPPPCRSTCRAAPRSRDACEGAVRIPTVLCLPTGM